MQPDTTEVQVGDIVLYRNSAGIDMPAIVTALTDDPRYLHLHSFAPPGVAADTQSYQWGTVRNLVDGEPVPRSWRPRP